MGLIFPMIPPVAPVGSLEQVKTSSDDCDWSS